MGMGMPHLRRLLASIAYGGPASVNAGQTATQVMELIIPDGYLSSSERNMRRHADLLGLPRDGLGNHRMVRYAYMDVLIKSGVENHQKAHWAYWMICHSQGWRA